MPFFIQRALRKVVSRQSWLLPVIVALLVFFISWGLLALAEPGNRVVAPERYWWYFLITASTVGYGDFYPTTLPGRLVGGFVVIGGIVTLTIIFARISTSLENAKGRRMNGLAHHDQRDHVVILGYTPGRTDLLVDALLEEGRTVVLAASPDQAEEHPLSDHTGVHFVRGDLTDTGVLRRTSPSRARAILVDARDDNEAVTLTVAVEEAATDVHTVVTLHDLERARTVRRVNDTVQCVQWHNRNLIIEELNDPGLAEVYRELMSASGPGTYSTPAPAGSDLSFAELSNHLGETHGATALAFRDDDGTRVNPPRETRIGAGCVVYYVAERRLAEQELMP